MAYAPHVRVSFGGKIVIPGEANEIWNCNVNIDDLAFTTDYDEDDYLAAVAAPLNAWFHLAVNGMANTASLDFVKANRINAAGHYADATATHQHVYPANNFGPDAQTVPSILSLCLSWTTDVARGPGAHGRVYPPNYAIPGVSMMVDDGNVTAAVGTAKGLLTAIKAGVATIHPVVASTVTATNYPITGVAVGNIRDVQRRRKNAYTEAYSVGVWP